MTETATITNTQAKGSKAKVVVDREKVRQTRREVAIVNSMTRFLAYMGYVMSFVDMSFSITNVL